MQQSLNLSVGVAIGVFGNERRHDISTLLSSFFTLIMTKMMTVIIEVTYIA